MADGRPRFRARARPRDARLRAARGTRARRPTIRARLLRAAGTIPYPPLGQIGPWTISAWAHLRGLSSRVEGLENVPRSGPTMLVARHAHHLHDGAMIVMRFPRPTHIVVGLDWAADATERARMEWACRAAEYPVVLRTPTLGRRGGYRKDEQLAYMRAALAETTRLLRAGRQLLIFPEGYPNVDPVFSQKANDDAMLPFEPGFARFAEAAERAGAEPVAFVPLGIAYAPDGRGRRRGVVRVGKPYRARDAADRTALVAALEADVRRLSGLG